MAEPFWPGGTYIKDEGGYEIVLKALEHYKKRLKTLSHSPELQNSAAMFASVLNQEARNTVPKIDRIIEKIHCVLRGTEQTASLLDDVHFLEKALSCYQSDIQKAQDTGHEYFLELVGDLSTAKDYLKPIDIAKDRIKQSTRI